MGAGSIFVLWLLIGVLISIVYRIFYSKHREPLSLYILISVAWPFLVAGYLLELIEKTEI